MKVLIFLVMAMLSPKVVSANDDFYVSADVTYEIGEESTKVLYAITIKNASTGVYAKDYTLVVKGGEVSKVRAFSEEGELETEVVSGEETRIKVYFDESAVGEGAERVFSIEYLDSSIVENFGEVREVAIPRLARDSIDAYIVRMRVPASFGRVAYMSPDATNSLATGGFITFYFDNLSSETGITAAFGEYQLFSFDLTYHLQNPLAIPVRMKVAIPPDTSYQKVYYETINPKPSNIYRDVDGNWIAVYSLGSRERLDVRAVGSAQIFSSAWRQFFTDEEAYANLGESEFWQTKDPALGEVASKLDTAREVYDYVVSALDYDYEKVTSGPNRLGALRALKNPDEAICTEFTDLFIALARAAGIPAREVNGYAYTDNARLRPLSLVADVLHAWPEYWDSERKVWVPVDPTWGDTTGGVDYFEKLDMRHLAFVMHNKDPEDPIPPGSYKLGANPQKDVFISAGGELASENSLSISISQGAGLPFGGIRLLAKIENPGPTALYDQKVELFYGNEKKHESIIPVLLPYESRTMEFTLPYAVFSGQTSGKVNLFVGQAASSFEPSSRMVRVRDAGAVVVFFSLGLGAIVVLKRRASAGR